MTKHYYLIFILVLLSATSLRSQNYYYKTYQITDEHRYDEGKMGGHWGHHLGHMVRTRTTGLWYVDDTGTNVNYNPALNYHHFKGNYWLKEYTINNPATIQQNTASIAVGDTIFTYGLNINGGYIEEAVFNTKELTGYYNRQIFHTGYSTNYIGAAVSPNGTKIVWWTRVVDNNGPAPWLYVYKDASGWNGPIESYVPGNDFSYVFATFLDDTTMYVAGEIPGGSAPNWTYKMGACKVVLGQPIEDLQVFSGNYTSHSIWVNKANADLHLFGHSFSGNVSYYWKPESGSWSDETYVPIGGVSRFRLIEDKNGLLYAVYNQSGFKTLIIDSKSIDSMIDFNQYEIIDLGLIDGYNASNSIWAEAPEYQTTPVSGLNFAYHGNDWTYSNYLRHLELLMNDHGVTLDISFPNGLEKFEGSEKRTISWFNIENSTVDSVVIELSANKGQNWIVLAKEKNTGYYKWTIPRIKSDSCLIRISDARDYNVFDLSDTTFSIDYTVVTDTLPIATIQMPTQDTTVTAGSSVDFKGIASDGDGYIVKYFWDTGDGRIVQGVSVKSFSHAYETPGIYDLTFKALDNDGYWSIADSLCITVSGENSLDDASILPDKYLLLSNYPNPFNPVTTIHFKLPQNDNIDLLIVDLNGHIVAELIKDTFFKQGSYSIMWDGINYCGKTVSSGFYLCILKTSNKVEVSKMVFIQ